MVWAGMRDLSAYSDLCPGWVEASATSPRPGWRGGPGTGLLPPHPVHPSTAADASPSRCLNEGPASLLWHHIALRLSVAA